MAFIGFFLYLAAMGTESQEARRRPSGHENDVGSPAPGALEEVRSFLSIHDHLPGDPDSLAPTVRSLEVWLRTSGAIAPADAVDERDLRWGLEVRTALRTKVLENMGDAPDARAARILDEAARKTGLRISFADPATPIRTEAQGVRGAIGRILAAAFLAELDGTWDRLRGCADASCTSVFYDRSKNHSSRWCSMASCGNRNKVRRFRERERQGLPVTNGDAG
jgi:hypothetical protein